MPYKDRERQKEYQRERLRLARLNWLDTNGPCVKCRSSNRLEIDHVDPKTKDSRLKKQHTNTIWSWSRERRKIELAKCQVLCYECHKEKTKKDLARPMPHGTDTGYTRYKCRCLLCKLAHTNKRKQDRIKYGC